MKRILIIGLLLLLCVIISQAQGIYSDQNLAQASIDDLNEYLRNARNKRNEGAIMTIAGPVACGAGILLINDNYIQGSRAVNGEKGSDAGLAAGFILFLGGFLSTGIGLPILVENSIRIPKVKKALIYHSGAGLNVAPSFVYNDKTQNFDPGITLRIRF